MFALVETVSRGNIPLLVTLVSSFGCETASMLTYVCRAFSRHQLEVSFPNTFDHARNFHLTHRFLLILTVTSMCKVFDLHESHLIDFVSRLWCPCPTPQGLS
jgi:hypothetical protein